MTTPSATAPAGQVHTATPWRVYENETGIGVTTASAEHEDTDGDGCDICAMDNEGVFGIDTVRANAAHIVHCVNTHSHIMAQNAVLLAQRDALIPYAKLYVDNCETCGGLGYIDGRMYVEEQPNKPCECCAKARAAIGVSP